MVKFINIFIIKIMVLFSILLTGCMPKPQESVESRNSQLTQGNVQLSVQVGKTTKAQVLDNFGSPNITTRDGTGKEIWTYQRSAQVTKSSSITGSWTILLAGQSGSSSGFENSSRMITLIIKFDENDIVSNFSSRTSNF